MVWTAQVINWWQLAGHGSTREEALAELLDAFELYRSTHSVLPRPGTGVPIEFASSELVETHEAIARDFVQRILNLNHDECFISDESSLWDFHGDETNDDYVRRILLIYGVDVSDVPDAKPGLIFETIAERRAG